ncbi:MAG: YIP1 family protein [Meiothermus sp.]|uniref:YIP1 family protein n=1 Tax=Meiothermus sp. TaxID=1955249 RepID=UPI0025DE401E|nr:YIP1 family protein [Meiothermus sp.]MCS7193595.1 YIP1 family protein [Meiothermus sp.]MDW8090608.1 YIP1 family protein [Meiothermus sp.]
MVEALLSPRQFFQALQERRPNLTAPFLIVLAASTLATLGNLLLVRLLPPSTPGGFALQLLLGLVGGVVGGIVFWGLGGLIIRLLAGPDSRAWEVYGWGNVPGLLVGLVLLPIGALFPITAELPPLPPLNDTEAFRAWQRTYQAAVASAPTTRVVQGLGLVSLAWSLWIIGTGLRVLVPQRAWLATLGVAAASLAFTLWGILGQG